MNWIEAENIILIRSQIIQVSGGLDGLRNRAGLKSAVAAPLQSYRGRDSFSTKVEKITRLGYGLAANLAFVDGNKRIVTMLIQLLLKWNDYRLELTDILISIADSSGESTQNCFDAQSSPKPLVIKAASSVTAFSSSAPSAASSILSP